jgi:hypothetical protein
MEIPMYRNISSLLTAPLVQLGCLTLPRQSRLLEDGTTAYDYRHPVLSGVRRLPICRCGKRSFSAAGATSKA